MFRCRLTQHTGRLRVDRQVDLVDRSLRVDLAVDSHHQGSRHNRLVDRPVVDHSPDAVVGIPVVGHLVRPVLLGKVLGLVVSRLLVNKGEGSELTADPVFWDPPGWYTLLGGWSSDGTSRNIGATWSATLAKLGHKRRVFRIELVLLVGLHVGISSSSTISSHVPG